MDNLKKKKIDTTDNTTDAGGTDRFMFVLRSLEKIKETRLKFSQVSVTVLYKMANYQKVKLKIHN